MTHEKVRAHLFPGEPQGVTAGATEQMVNHTTDFEYVKDALHVIDDVPLILDRIPLKPRSKAPLNRGWRRSPALTDAKVAAHLAAGGNVGAMLRDDQLVVDADPRAYEPGDDPLARLTADFGLPSGPTVETGGGGRHVYLRIPAGLKLRGSLADYPGIEFKSVGRQVVIPPSVHPDTGCRYMWDPLAPETEPVPFAPERLVAQLQRPDRTSVASDLVLTSEQFETALNRLNVLDFSDYPAWLELAMSCHAATDGEGLDVFVEWCAGDPTYVDKLHTIPSHWASFDVQGGISIGTFSHILNKKGHGDIVDAFHRSPAAVDFPAYDDRPVEEKAPAPDLIDQMNERFCGVVESGSFVVFRNDIDSTFTPPREVLTRMSRRGFIEYHEDERVRVPGQERKVSKAEFWLKSPRRRKYEGIVFDPTSNDPSKLNLWRGWAVEPKPGNWSLMRQLIEEVLVSGDVAHAEYVVKWLAFMFQHPEISPQSALAFRGGEGTGKSTFGRALLALTGTHGMTVSSPSQFAGRFNAHLRNVVCLFADEASTRGNREAEGIVKQLVTEPTIAFEAKGKDVVSGRNMVHLIMASNHEWIIPAGMDARRFAVFDVADTRKGDAAFFTALNAQLESGGLAAMLHDLREIDLTSWHPSHNVPQTQALADQKEQSLKPAQQFWLHYLTLGMLPVTGSLDWEGGPVTLDPVAKGEMVEAYGSFLAKHRLIGNATHKALTTAGEALGLDTCMSMGGKERHWTLPSLADACRAFEKSLGSQGMFDWSRLPA